MALSGVFSALEKVLNLSLRSGSQVYAYFNGSCYFSTLCLGLFLALELDFGRFLIPQLICIRIKILVLA